MATATRSTVEVTLVLGETEALNLRHVLGQLAGEAGRSTYPAFKALADALEPLALQD